MKPKISIIVPVYNVEKYLEKCINSIINQTFSDFELILIDDGSTDKSTFICDEYINKDNRIIVRHKKNGGLSSARNVGLDLARGDYIAFIDSDDWISPCMIETLYNNLIAYEADISQCDLIKTRRENNPNNYLNDNDRINVFTNVNLLNKLHENSEIKYTVVWNKLYLAKLWLNIRFPEGKIHEDEFVNYKIIYKANKIVCCNQKLYYYRQRADSIMGSKFNLSRLDKLDALSERIRFYKKMKYTHLYQKEIIFELKHIMILYQNVKDYISNNHKIKLNLRRRYYILLKQLIISGYREPQLLKYLINLLIPNIITMEKY